MKANYPANGVIVSTRPTYLVVVRHGESEGNWAHHLEREGQFDAIARLNAERHETNYRLTDYGRWQLAQTGAWLAREYPKGFRRYYCSDTVRGMESAAHLGLPNADWEPVSLLRERDSREFAALTQEEQEKVRAQLKGAMLDSNYYFHPLGEAPAQLIDHRISPMLDRVSDLHSVIWVCHGDFMRALKARIWHLTKDDWKRLYQDETESVKRLNGCVHVYTRQDPDCPTECLPYFGWFRSYCPWAPDHPSNTDGWVPIERKKFSNEDLRASVAQYPQLVNRAKPATLDTDV